MSKNKIIQTFERKLFTEEIERRKFKDTEIGRIPREWEVVDVGNFVEIETGKRAKGGGLAKGTVASIGGEHIDRSGNIIWSDMKFIPENFYDNLTQGKVRTGDVLIVKDGATTGKVAFVRRLFYPKVAVNEHVFIIRSKSENLSNEFLFYIMFSSIGQDQIKMKFHGIIGGIKRGEIKSLKIPLPPLHEQHRIAEILSTVDEAIQRVDEAIARTERLKRGLMQRLLTRGIGHKEFKFSKELSCEIPKEWEVVRLGNMSIAELVMGQSPPSSTYNKNKKGLPFLQGKIEFGEIHPSPTIYCSNPIKIAEPNDILLSVRAPVGEVNVAEFRCCIGRGVSAIRPKQDKLHQLFLFYFLKSSSKKFEALSAGSTFKAIRRQEIENYSIPLPPLPEQRRIAEILSTTDKKLELERKRKEKLERIKKGLMNDLLTGKVRVKI